MGQLRLVAVGVSAGGLQDLPMAILVVVHTRSEGDGLLAQILGRINRLP